MSNRVTDVEARLSQMEATYARERMARISKSIDNLVNNFQLTRDEAPNALTRALGDETYLDELRMREKFSPDSAPLNSGVSVTGEDGRNILAGIRKHLVEGPQCSALSPEDHVRRGREMTRIITKERERILPVLNAAATNTVDAALKRVVILNENIRDFATRLLPLRLFSSVFSNVPLQGTDQIEVPYYPLQTVASSNFTDGDGTGGTGYQFGQATTTNKAQITVNKRKYQPIDYSSYEFRRQPFFDAVKLGKLNAERLAVDTFNDVISVVTTANFPNVAKTGAAQAITSDDIVDVRYACNTASWPDSGRSLIVDDTVDQSLSKDTAYKLALNIGTASVIQRGEFPNLSGFSYAHMPNLPQNGCNLIGFAAFASGILSAFCPIDPAPGVRRQLVAYEVVTDPQTGISFNYRHWGLAQADRDFEIIEVAYGYQPGVTAAVKLIVHP